MPIRLIVTDIDGTLLNPSGIITERSRQAIRAAHDQGITVAIATGRFPENAYLLLEEYGLRLPIIGINGARIVDENLREISRREMARSTALRVLDVLLEAGADFFVFGDRAICTATKAGVHHSELTQGDRARELSLRYFHGREEAKSFVRELPVFKFFVCDNVPLPPLRKTFSALGGLNVTQSWWNNIELMPEGVDKGRGVRDMAASLGLPMEDVMTLGDENNDLPMLKAAGWGVAMGNASEETKRAARCVTASNAEDGFAQAIEKYALMR